jgi:hypothetical protein
MAKSLQPSPARLALEAAHDVLAAARAAHAQAEAARDTARRAYGRARSEVSDIDERIASLQTERTHGIGQLVADKFDKIAEARSAREAAQRAAYPFGVADDEAQAHVNQAKLAVLNAETRVARAAQVVVVAEVEPIAREHFAQCEKAFAILLKHGPDLVAMIDKDLVAKEFAREVEGAADNMLRRATAWQEFEARYRNSPWRGAAQLLAQDPAAPLLVSTAS